MRSSRGGIDTGWTFYTPFSTIYSNTYVAAAAIGIFIVGFSSIMTGLNFIVTIHRLRAPGMTWFRLPLFIWSHYATSVVMVLATPVLAITLLMVVVERVFQVGIFSPALGGDPVLFQHMFWFYSHPAVYIMVLPSMGVVSELVAAFSRRAVFGYVVCRVFERRRLRSWVFGVGPSHVRGRRERLFRNGFFGPELCGRGAVCNQGFQLERHIVQRLYLLGHAHVVRPWLHRPIHNWRDDGTVSGSAGNRRPCDRYVLRRSRISTTSWWADPSWVTWAACITGGLRSAAECIRNASPRRPP